MANPNERSGSRDKNKTGSASRSRTSSTPTARQPGNTNQGMQTDIEGKGRNKEGHTGQRESGRTSDLNVE